MFSGLSGPAFSEAVALAQADERYLLCTDALRGVGEIAYAVSLVGASRVVYGSGGVARGSVSASLAVAKVAKLSDTTGSWFWAGIRSGCSPLEGR